MDVSLASIPDGQLVSHLHKLYVESTSSEDIVFPTEDTARLLALHDEFHRPYMRMADETGRQFLLLGYRVTLAPDNRLHWHRAKNLAPSLAAIDS